MLCAVLYSDTVVLTGSDAEAKREEIRLYFHRTFTIYEKLFEVLKDEVISMGVRILRVYISLSLYIYIYMCE